MLIQSDTKERELNRLLADLSTPCLTDNVVLGTSTSNIEEELGDEVIETRVDEVTMSGDEGVTEGVVEGVLEGDVDMDGGDALEIASTVASTIHSPEEYLVTDSSDYMDSIDGEDMSTHPVTVSEISPQTYISLNTPPQTSGEATLPADVDDMGDHIYVNRHMVPIDANTGDVDLDACPTISDINPTPPTTPPGPAGDNLYENLPEEIPPDPNDLYENLPEDLSTNGPSSVVEAVVPSSEDMVEGYHSPASPFSMTLSADDEFTDPSIALLEMSNLEERDDLLEDKLKPDVESLRRRLWFYLRQDVRRQNIKFCYDLLDNVSLPFFLNVFTRNLSSNKGFC